MIIMSKLNKKGFTLIELLAVIAILAILMLLVTPQILNLFTQGKKNTFAIQVQSIYKAAEEKFVSESFKPGGGATTFCHEMKKTNGNSLNLNFDDIMSYKVEINAASGNVSSIVAYDSTYYYASTGDVVKITDINDDTIKDIKEKPTDISCGQ